MSAITPAIRLAQQDDADAVRLLVRAAYAPWIERFGREPSPMQDDYGQRIADGEVWVLEEDESLIGCVMLRDGPQALMMPNLAVAPAAQGKGYGRRLIDFAETEARRRGYAELRLFVNSLMTENIALYHHLGFVEIERIQTEGELRSYLCLARPVARGVFDRDCTAMPEEAC
jgi:ribosomal protein S18 acetylase RimI-like enzyme